MLKKILATAALIAAFPLGASAAHSDSRPFAVSQVNGQPVVSIENVGYKEKPVSISLDLYDKDGHLSLEKSWTGQTIPLHASSTYSLGPLFLTPSGSPYRMAVKIETDKKHPKAVEEIDTVATFTVYH